MSVAPIGKLKSNGFFNQSSTSIVVSKESGVTFVLPDGVELPERFEYVESEKNSGMYGLTYLSIFCVFLRYRDRYDYQNGNDYNYRNVKQIQDTNWNGNYSSDHHCLYISVYMYLFNISKLYKKKLSCRNVAATH